MNEPMVIVEVESHVGHAGSIVVRNDRAAAGEGAPATVFCVGALGGDGVIRFVDWGYATAAAARAAWPDARHTSEFMLPQ